jgi:hypothetical protein
MTDKNKTPKRKQDKQSDDFKSFDEAASKLFKVPVEEVRELEDKKSDAKS